MFYRPLASNESITFRILWPQRGLAQFQVGNVGTLNKVGAVLS